MFKSENRDELSAIKRVQKEMPKGYNTPQAEDQSWENRRRREPEEMQEITQ